MRRMKPGYILHSDTQWVDYHIANSNGGAVAYCRGLGAPFQNVEAGGKLFFRNRSVSPKEIAFWADFDQAIPVTVDEAWERFGSELGSQNRSDWNQLTARLLPIANSGRLIVIRGVNAVVPPAPVRLSDVGVTERRNATKGWSIDLGDVQRILGALVTTVTIDRETAPPERVNQTVSRVVRDTAIIRRLKLLHNYQCQICGETIVLPDEQRYCEGHHLQPLGSDHNGPDVEENVICVCPNHHAAFDFGAIRIETDTLRRINSHRVGQQYINYHNERVYRP